ncbi:hypothetical protein [Synechocystis sp. PCC 6714]|nr:hypothetical protein [Synechocystis sp. PCC 6714]AIE73843.1 hypothetical protein D082_13150 [Synechocystis sp. PCC 6714]
MLILANSDLSQINSTLQSGYEWGTSAGLVIFGTTLALTVAAYFFYKI